MEIILIIVPILTLIAQFKARSPFIKTIARGFNMIFGLAIFIVTVMYFFLNGSIVAGFIVIAFLGVWYYFTLPIYLINSFFRGN